MGLLVYWASIFRDRYSVPACARAPPFRLVRLFYFYIFKNIFYKYIFDFTIYSFIQGAACSQSSLAFVKNYKKCEIEKQTPGSLASATRWIDVPNFSARIDPRRRRGLHGFAARAHPAAGSRITRAACISRSSSSTAQGSASLRHPRRPPVLLFRTAYSHCRLPPPNTARRNNNLFSMLRVACRAVRPGLDSHTPRALCKYAAFFLCLFVAQFLQILNFILSRARLEVGDPTAPWRKAAPPSPA